MALETWCRPQRREDHELGHNGRDSLIHLHVADPIETIRLVFECDALDSITISSSELLEPPINVNDVFSLRCSSDQAVL